MPSTTNYLISGTTRGIGKGLVSHLALRPNTIIFAGVRDPSAKAAQALQALPTGDNSKIVLVILNATSETDANDAVKVIREGHGVDHLDVVVANAGIMTPEAVAPLKDVAVQHFREHFEINTLGPIILFQAVLPLLRASPSPKFAITTSAIGSNAIASSIPFPIGVYGVSKAAVNWFLSRVTAEHPDITFIPIHPGLVETDMMGSMADEQPNGHSGEGEKQTGMEGMPKPITVEESVKGYLNVLDTVKLEKDSGRFVQWDGETVPW